MAQLYSIGYATKPLDTFLEQLAANRIAAVADVRSVPYSKRFYDYHREALQATLRARGIYYIYMGEELGPRSKDDNHYDNCGQVQFDRLMTSALFQKGIERLQNGLSKGLNIALLCAEKDPAECHRSLLVGYYLKSRLALEVTHIGHHGELESQAAMEDRLAELHGVKGDLFLSTEQQLHSAWKQQCQRMAYTRPATDE
ncbi:DUF488 domain-containing protein [bacterium SCSIO 12696]|nr:DUF488 domain-containing protein [bacterium SCSIO 12696]